MSIRSLLLAVALNGLAPFAAAHPPVPTLVVGPPFRTPGFHQSGTISNAEVSDLLAHPATWPEVVSRHPLLQVADEHLAYENDVTLKLWMAEVRADGLTFGVESTPLSEGNKSGANAFARYSKWWSRIATAGGTLSEVATNDPLAIGLKIGLMRQQAISEIAKFITLTQQHFPAAAVGFNAVYPKMESAQQIADLQALQAALAADGSRGLDFYRVDFDWTRVSEGQGSFADMKVVSDYCDSVGLPFSLIYTGAGYYGPAVRATHAPPSAADDIFWSQGVMEEAGYVAGVGMKPYQIDLQDWVGAPTRAEPETDPATYAGSAKLLLDTLGR